MTTPTPSPLIEPTFWTQPLADRMAQFAEIRERTAFERVGYENMLTGEHEEFYAATRYDDVVEISRRPKDFCSGKGAVSIPDMPEEALDFFGSFINMDDPRHARQRGIVSRSFTPRQLARACSTRSRPSAPRSSTASARTVRPTSSRSCPSRSRCSSSAT